MQKSSPRRDSAANQKAVFEVLSASDKPMTAYEVIDALRPGLSVAPPTVYRALSGLIDRGLAHRLESLNAFVACAHDHGPGEAAIFSICDSCGGSNELHAAGLMATLRDQAETVGFAAERAVIELRGRCADCRSRA